MNQLNDLETLLTALKAVNGTNAKERFTQLFERGCALLELDDDNAARVFDTSRPNASRWRRGKVVPPAAALILRFLREEVEAKIKTRKRLEARAASSVGSASVGSAAPVFAKSG